MRLESAVYTGREGMIVHGQAISVVGDNIANVNTTAYKQSRAEFGDLMSNYEDESTFIPTAGNGVVVQQIRQNFGGGTLEPTDRPLDVGIDGEGFFMVGTAADPLYTRAGNFSVNAAGNLVDGNNLPVLGIPNGQTELGPLSLDSLKLTGAATTQASVNANIDATSPISTPPTGAQTFNQLNNAASFSGNISVYDSLGASHDVALYFFRTGANQWTAQAYIDSKDTGGVAGVPVQVGADAQLQFSSSGILEPANQAAAVIANVAPAYSNGAAAGNFSINLAGLTQFAAPSGVTGNNIDGSGSGNVTGFEITPGGRLEAILDSGTRQLVGTLQLAKPTNVDGLDRAGSNLYRASGSTGAITRGDPNNAGLGALQGNSLERSNVDITNEFVDLVVYQRGYQANSQAISTANQLLRDTIGLIR